MSEDICSLCCGLKKVAARNPTLCPRCYANTHKEECCMCHKVRTVNARNAEGLAKCHECNRKKDQCSCCGKIRTIKYVLDGGKGLCGNCRSKQKKSICVACGRSRIVVARTKGEALCHECYKNLHKRICVVCGNTRKIKTGKKHPICDSCWRKTKIGICAICGEQKPLNNTVQSNKVCVNCYHRHRTEVCGGCGRQKIIARRYDGQAFCYACYYARRKATDPKFRIKLLLRKRFKEAMRLFVRSGRISKSSKYIDYNRCFEHLGPPPDDGETYHIDHLFPLAAFDLSNELDIIMAWLPENLRWLRAQDNLVKSDNFDPLAFDEFKRDMWQRYPIQLVSISGASSLGS